MLLSAVSVLVVAQSSSEIPEGLMNNPVFLDQRKQAKIQWLYDLNKGNVFNLNAVIVSLVDFSGTKRRNI